MAGRLNRSRWAVRVLAESPIAIEATAMSVRDARAALWRSRRSEPEIAVTARPS